MSLHLGNIPPHIRRDELEHVFHRFGRCTVRLKDKFGFVVYEYPANAEKALNTLRGKTICGKPITLSWSNMQPRPKPFRRFSRSTRSFEPPRGKHSARHDHVYRHFDYNGHQRHKRELRSADTNGGRTVHADPVDDPVDDYASHQRYEGHTSVDDFPDDSGGREATVFQNGEVKEQYLEPLDQNGLEDGPEFDRYVPSCTDEIDELHHLTCVEISASPRRPEEETERERPNAGGNTVPSSLQVDVKKKESSRSRHRSRHRDSLRERTAHRKGRKDYGKNKQRKATIETPSYSKNDRAPVTNSICSNRTASGSHSHSRSLKSFSQPSDLMPNSSPARRNSQYSSLRSGPTSHSRSASPISQSLSGSLDRSLSSSSNKAQTEKKDLVPELKVNELKGQPLEKSDAGSDNSFKMKGSHASESYTGDHIVRSVFPHTLVGTGELQNSNDLTEQHEKALDVLPDVQVLERSHVATLMKLSPEEVDMVLKHYRLEGPEEMLKNSPVEDCFGCARSWPWEIIYYRRYKKGHISTENYARRLSQNKEFGIVDKFVRSSSGWGEV